MQGKNDIIEDQRIHYIVKDYRRMYNGYQYLKSTIDEQKKALMEKDKEILSLKSKISELKGKQPEDTVPKGKLKGILNDVESITNSLKAKLSQSVSQADKISNSIEELRQLINV